MCMEKSDPEHNQNRDKANNRDIRIHANAVSEARASKAVSPATRLGTRPLSL